jgi:hypothetical protein
LGCRHALRSDKGSVLWAVPTAPQSPSVNNDAFPSVGAVFTATVFSVVKRGRYCGPPALGPMPENSGRRRGARRQPTPIWRTRILPGRAADLQAGAGIGDVSTDGVQQSGNGAEVSCLFTTGSIDVLLRSHYVVFVEGAGLARGRLKWEPGAAMDFGPTSIPGLPRSGNWERPASLALACLAMRHRLGSDAQ